MRMTSPTFLGLLLATAAPSSLASQDLPTQRPAHEVDDGLAAKIPGRLDWERDKGIVIAKVDGHEVRLEELGRYIRDRYDSQLLVRWGDPNGSRDLNSPAVSQLLWQYADLLCLRAEVKAKGLPLAGIKDATDKILTAGFETYAAKLEKTRGKLTPAARRTYVRRYRREQGLRAESRALLDLLVPTRFTQSELRQWHADHGDVFGGKVELAHIYMSMRDPATGRLLPPKERRRKRAFLENLMTRLREKPQDFAKFAEAHSEDTSTKERGGRFTAWAKRFGSPLPPPIVRAAWNVRNGEITGPVESYYGLHIVRRLDQAITKYILFYDGTIQRITDMQAEDTRENFLAEMRKRHTRRLYL